MSYAFCIPNRIGGIGGKRITLTMIDKIIFPKRETYCKKSIINEYLNDFSMDFFDFPIKINYIYPNLTLKCKNGLLDLFFEYLRRDYKNTNYKNTGIILIKFEKDEIQQAYLSTLSDLSYNWNLFRKRISPIVFKKEVIRYIEGDFNLNDTTYHNTFIRDIKEEDK